MHVTPVLWSGAGAALVRLVEAQRASGSHVTVVSSSRTAAGDDWPALRRRLRAAGVRLEALDFFSRDMATFWASVDGLSALVRRDRPALVHTHAGVPACAVAVLRDRGAFDGGLIAHLNSWGIDRPAWMDRMDAWGLGRADRVVCISRTYRDRLAALGVSRPRLRYVPWGVDVPARAAAPPREGRSRRIGFVGRIEPRKRQHLLVEAFARLHGQSPDLRLSLVGPIADASYAAALRARIHELDLDQAVLLHGHVRDTAPHVLRWAAFVSPSSDEGQGLAVLEAMALGVPVVALRAPGIEDYLDDGRTGVLVGGRSPSALAAGIRRLLEHPREARRLASRAAGLVARSYGWEACLGSLARIYAEARDSGQAQVRSKPAAGG
jgi:glycosyltransferase involved in cell wall biosynthesis